MAGGAAATARHSRLRSGQLSRCISVFGVDWITEKLAQEVSRGMREAATRGFWMSSRAPYGYTKVMVQDGAKKRPVLEPNPVTAPVVQRMFEMAQAGKGILDITRTLNEEGIANPTGRLWSKTGIHNILCNEVYTGTMTWGESAREKAEPVRVEKAFHPIISKSQFRRVNKQMRSRAPKKAHPRRVGSTYLLSGLVKCKQCRRALSGQDSKSGKFSYYVCQSLMNRGTGACKAPRLNARRFEEMVVGQIRSNILTEGNIRDLVRLVDEEMDGVAGEQRKRLETIEAEFAPVISYVPIPRKIYTVGPLTRKDRVARAPPRSGTTPPSEQTKLEQFVFNCVLTTVYRIIMPHAWTTHCMYLPQFPALAKTHGGRHAPHPPTRRWHRLSTWRCDGAGRCGQPPSPGREPVAPATP